MTLPPEAGQLQLMPEVASTCSTERVPERIRRPDLCVVRSIKAQHLKRIKPDFFNPPGGRPICVSGFHWVGLLVVSWQGPSTVAVIDGWTAEQPWDGFHLVGKD